MAIKIGGNNVFDDNRRTTIDTVTVNSYTKSQLASLSGSAAGDIVYGSDVDGGRLVAWTGSQWNYATAAPYTITPPGGSPTTYNALTQSFETFTAGTYAMVAGPADFTTTIHAVGAGGGNGSQDGGGGGGGYTTATAVFKSGEIYVIVVGDGGPGGPNPAPGVGGGTGGDGHRGGGGGYAGIFHSSVSFPNAAMIAGGGGGNGTNPRGGGGGGGVPSGRSSSGPGPKGSGGTQSAGGSPGNGSALQGGYNLAGGGGGYYGGGGGADNGSYSPGAGGGSGYYGGCLLYTSPSPRDVEECRMAGCG